MTRAPSRKLQVVQAGPITSIEIGCSLQGYTSCLHSLHYLQNLPHARRPPLPASLFDARVPPVFITPSNVIQHSVPAGRQGEGLRHAV